MLPSTHYSFVIFARRFVDVRFDAQPCAFESTVCFKLWGLSPIPRSNNAAHDSGSLALQLAPLSQQFRDEASL